MRSLGVMVLGVVALLLVAATTQTTAVATSLTHRLRVSNPIIPIAQQSQSNNVQQDNGQPQPTPSVNPHQPSANFLPPQQNPQPPQLQGQSPPLPPSPLNFIPPQQQIQIPTHHQSPQQQQPQQLGVQFGQPREMQGGVHFGQPSSMQQSPPPPPQQQPQQPHHRESASRGAFQQQPQQHQPGFQFGQPRQIQGYQPPQQQKGYVKPPKKAGPYLKLPANINTMSLTQLLHTIDTEILHALEKTDLRHRARLLDLETGFINQLRPLQSEMAAVQSATERGGTNEQLKQQAASVMQRMNAVKVAREQAVSRFRLGIEAESHELIHQLLSEARQVRYSFRKNGNAGVNVQQQQQQPQQPVNNLPQLVHRFRQRVRANRQQSKEALHPVEA